MTCHSSMCYCAHCTNAIQHQLHSAHYHCHTHNLTAHTQCNNCINIKHSKQQNYDILRANECVITVLNNNTPDTNYQYEPSYADSFVPIQTPNDNDYHHDDNDNEYNIIDISHTYNTNLTPRRSHTPNRLSISRPTYTPNIATRNYNYKYRIIVCWFVCTLLMASYTMHYFYKQTHVQYDVTQHNKPLYTNNNILDLHNSHALPLGSDIDIAAYRHTIELGYEYMSGISIVICGTVRDQSQRLKLTYSRLLDTVSHFSDYRIVVYENDSKDATATILESITQRNSKVIGISERLGIERAASTGAFSDRRFHTMATIRNSYLHKVRSDAELNKMNYMLVLDFDNEHGWSIDGLAHTFGLMVQNTIHTTDVICANGIVNNGYHWDTLAFRNSEFNDTLHSTQQRMRAHQQWAIGSDLIAVDSCFGGLTIYNMKTITESQCQYSGADCEHVQLHRCIHDTIPDITLYINPSMLVYYGIVMDVFWYQHMIAGVTLLTLPSASALGLLIYTYCTVVRNIARVRYAEAMLLYSIRTLFDTVYSTRYKMKQMV